MKRITSQSLDYRHGRQFYILQPEGNALMFAVNEGTGSLQLQVQNNHSKETNKLTTT